METAHGGFFSAVRPFLVFSQAFGILPCCGALQHDVRFIRFRWLSFPIFWTLVNLLLGGIQAIFSLHHTITSGINFFTAGPTIFYVTSMSGLLLFLNLGRQWPRIMGKWAHIDKIFSSQVYADRKILSKLPWIAWSFVAGLTVEHLLYLSSSINDNRRYIRNCNITVGFWEHYIKSPRPNFFEIFPYQSWMVGFFMWSNVSLTFCWNFIDIFLTLVALALAERFMQVLRRIQQAIRKSHAQHYWTSIRMDFLELYDFLDMIDDHMAGLILISCLTNFYYTILNVFSILRERTTVLQSVYFWFSLTFVTIRICCMLFSAALVNDAAQRILTALRDIPSSVWNIELQRITDVVATDTISLSGKKFFHITRRFIFGWAGTALGYILVLLDSGPELIQDKESC